jgi:hypothetical protein
MSNDSTHNNVGQATVSPFDITPLRVLNTELRLKNHLLKKEIS